MKRISLTIVVAAIIFLVARNEAGALVVNFDNFASPTDNDYATFFNDSESPPYFTQQPTGGITGGALIPGTFGSFGNTKGTFKEPLTNASGVVHEFSVSFLYDSSLSNPNRNNTLFIFWLDSTTANRHIYGGIRGFGTDLQLGLVSFSKASVNEQPNAEFTLIDGHWYKLTLIINNKGGPFGEVFVEGQLFDLGTSGTDTPNLIATESMTTFDEFWSPSPALTLSIISEQWGGAAALDNLEISGIPDARVVINIPGGKVQECRDIGGSQVDLTATVAPLPPGDVVTSIEWFLDGTSVGSGESLNTFVTLGHHMIEVFITTTQANSSTTTFIDIVDTTEPEVTLSVTDVDGNPLSSISGRGLNQVAVQYQINDVCDAEPVATATAGVPVQSGDIVRINPKREELRVTGTHFVVNVGATDASGNSTVKEVSLPIAE